jgi:hypothetical protein
MSENLKNKEVSRRGALAAAGLAVVSGLGVKKEAHADDTKLTKDDLSELSFNMANQKVAADKFERSKNKATSISADSTEDTYPSSKAVFDFISEKESYQQDADEVGKALFVGENGNTILKEYTVDTVLKEDSQNPVQGGVVVQNVENLKKGFSKDQKPTKHEHKEGDVEGLKYVCESNGYYVTYQQAKAMPDDVTTAEQGVNYAYTTKAIDNSDRMTWGVKKIDAAYIAINEDEFTGFRCSSEANAKEGVWSLPKLVWHS